VVEHSKPHEVEDLMEFKLSSSTSHSMSSSSSVSSVDSVFSQGFMNSVSNGLSKSVKALSSKSIEKNKDSPTLSTPTQRLSYDGPLPYDKESLKKLKKNLISRDVLDQIQQDSLFDNDDSISRSETIDSVKTDISCVIAKNVMKRDVLDQIEEDSLFGNKSPVTSKTVNSTKTDVSCGITNVPKQVVVPANPDFGIVQQEELPFIGGPRTCLLASSISNPKESFSLIQDIKSLQNCVDSSCRTLYGSWESKIIMDLEISSSEGIDARKDDVLKYINKKSNKVNGVTGNSIIYFNTVKYKVGSEGFQSDGFKDLCRDLGNKALSSGFYLIKNGFKKRKPYYCQEFTCNRYQVYKGDIRKKKLSSTVYRGKSYNHDRRLNRASGQSLPRMTSTLKPSSKENRCKFCFYVGMDEKGFVIANGGSNVHCHHPRLCEDEISYPTNLLSSENLSAITDLAHSTTNLGVAVNFVKYRTGKVLNRNKIRWLRGLCNDLRSIPNLPKKDSTEIMTQYLIEKKYDFMLLLHDNNTDRLFNEANLESSFTNEVIMPVPEKTSCLSFAQETRKNLDVLNDETLLMGLAWTLPKEKHYFNMFPEVIFVDVIVDVNKDKRPLLTVTGKDASAKMFTLLRAFLPNEKQWAFRWIFSNVFPRSFPPSILGRVRLIISDGCVQEFSQIDNAISLCFPNKTNSLWVSYHYYGMEK